MMKNKALKQYIEEKYNVKIKKARIWGLFGTPLVDTFYVIAKSQQLDTLNSGLVIEEYKLFETLSEILDFLKEKNNE